MGFSCRLTVHQSGEFGAALIRGTDGNFYGTSLAGGTVGYGCVFKITPGGRLTTLHNFGRLPSGTYPMRGSNPVIFKIYVGLENPELNLTLRSGPSDYARARHFQWYVRVIPGLTRAAGFERGSGMFINTVLPDVGA